MSLFHRDTQCESGKYTYKDAKQALKNYDIPNRSRLTKKVDMCKAIVEYLRNMSNISPTSTRYGTSSPKSLSSSSPPYAENVPLFPNTSCPEITKLEINKLMEKIQYKEIKKNDEFYRGLAYQDRRSETCLPFYRGLYTSTMEIASGYAYDMMINYETVRSLRLFIVSPQNIKIIYKLLEKLKDIKNFKLYLRNGSVLSVMNANKIIEIYSNMVMDERRQLRIYTQQMLTFRGYTTYSGLWFAEILCYFGFDGYCVPPHKYYRNKREGDVLFHEEYYFCNPITNLKIKEYYRR